MSRHIVIFFFSYIMIVHCSVFVQIFFSFHGEQIFPRVNQIVGERELGSCLVIGKCPGPQPWRRFVLPSGERSRNGVPILVEQLGPKVKFSLR